MELVGIGSENYKQPHAPSEKIACPGEHQYARPDAEQEPRAIEPIVAREIPRIMVMQDVGSGDEAPQNRPILLTVRVLKPMEQSRDKVRDQHRSDDF